MISARPADFQLATKVAATLVALTAATAAVVHFLAAERARAMLDFGFAGVPPTFGTAAGIFANNARVLAAILLACLAVEIGREIGGSGFLQAVGKAIALTCDAGLLGLSCLQIVVIGAAYGAYGLQTVRATVLHGPFELAAFSIALSLYISARCEPLRGGRFAVAAAAALALLAAGAVVETLA